MGNVVDYVRSEFRTFDELAFSNVDSLVLSELSYMRLSGLVPTFETAKSVATVPIARLLRAEDYPVMFASNSNDMNDYRLSLLRAVCESPRFRGLRVGEYAERLDERREQQFAAMTFDLGDCPHVAAAQDRDDSADSPTDAAGLLYVAFRGTDGTLVGWKEDFNMAVRCPVPSQESAYRYVDSVMDRSSGFLSASPAPGIMIGGHSKGGNMATYAAMLVTQHDIARSCERARNLGLMPALGGAVEGRNGRIRKVYSHDGPGLPQAMVDGQAYRAIGRRIDKTVPESSIVGMLLQTSARYTVVKADAIGIMQHLGSSWRVTGGAFERANGLSGVAQVMKRTIDAWLETVGQEQRERAINQIYEIFASTGYANIADLTANWTDSLPKILAAAKSTDRETRTLILDVLKAVPASAAKALDPR
ncbi:Mbeg1-like protein [Bifidobacterium moukalabense]|uniref:Mbeg1-like protein n=1 Tax=Bifidobacterium moukalabense TaxID=1333651 RepID=UPI0010F4F958|nr:Mbeg1-like protein [Bifidobacterium moukalabense]